MKKIRQIVLVGDLQYDTDLMSFLEVWEALPDYFASALDCQPSEKDPYRILNPTVYLSLADFDGDRRDGIGPFFTFYYRCHTIEVWPNNGEFIAWLKLHAWLPIELWARNGYASILEAKAPTAQEALSEAMRLIDSRWESGKLPDVDEANYERCEHPSPLNPMPHNDQELKRKYLSHLYHEAERLRRELGISAPDSVLCRYDSPCDDEAYIAVADGMGKAFALRVEGNFPIDYFTHECENCETEDAACRLAAKWAGEEEEDDDQDAD